MEKLFNQVSLVVGAVGGFILGLLGGWDKLLYALSILIVIDYVTGLLKGVYNKDLASRAGFKGIVKKVFLLVVVVVANVVQMAICPELPIREMVITFFICNEGLSVLENAAQMGLPIHPKLKELLLQIREGGENDESIKNRN